MSLVMIMCTGGPAEVERPSIDKMTLAEMESVIKADLEKRDKEKQDKYQEPLDSQKEKGKYSNMKCCIHYNSFDILKDFSGNVNIQ